MNRPILPILLLSLSFFIQLNLAAQDTGSLPHHMTQEEKGRSHEIGRDFYPTLPPAGPVRHIAEFEHMQAVLIRYPFGIPMNLVAEMSENCNILTIVLNQSQENTVRNQYQAAGVNMDNLEFLYAPTDSYWTRDYGPWFVVNGNNEVGVCNFPYNRPRPNDNDIPIEVAEYLGIELYGMNLIHTGGNYMCDGWGIASSTTLVWDENPSLSTTQINNLVESYLGIHTYHVLPDPLGEYIEHIDCWGKFLDVDKVLIGEVPPSDPRYDDFEYVAEYFEDQISSYGTPYQVFRVYTPGNYPYTPYTNSLILNKKVFVPLTGSIHDNAALQVYEEAMPGYEVIGITYGSWENTDALHCRTKGVADIGMLYIRHMPLHGNIPQSEEFTVTAEIIPYSQEPVYEDSLFIYYSVNGGPYSTTMLYHVSDYTYSGEIPQLPANSNVKYYLYAADESGRRMTHPYIGEPDPHAFKVSPPLPDLIVNPDSLIFTDPVQAIEGQNIFITNTSDANLHVNNINFFGYEPFVWYIVPDTLSFPYLVFPGDTLILTVYIDLPVNRMEGFMQDTVFIETEAKIHDVYILADSTLFSLGIGEGGNFGYGISEFSVFPNPFRTDANISLDLIENAHVIIDLFTLNGKKIKTLADRYLLSGSHNFTAGSVNGLKSGVYIVRLHVNGMTYTRKLIMMK